MHILELGKKMGDALIGFSGFVGTTLRKQTRFQSVYRSTDIEQIRGKKFDTVVCAGAPAQKWLANKEPEQDANNIDVLISHLKCIECNVFILISTVDVFGSPIGVDEATTVEENGLHPYGFNRRRLEKFVEQNFSKYLIVRLPGLIGPGLRKNIIFDILNDNNILAIDSRSKFQFYPMVNLWYDVQIALKADLKLVHLTAEPVSVASVANLGFGKLFLNVLERPVATYDFRTRYADVFGVSGNYQYTERETIQAVRSYAQSESLISASQPPL